VALGRTGRRLRINPSPDDEMRPGDTLMVIGTPRQLHRLEGFLSAEGTAPNGGAA